MYELIILSLLARAPMHGYLLAKVINDKIGPWARVSNGTLYPLLARLEHTGLVTTTGASDDEGAGGRECRRYAISEAGRRRFHQVMLDTAANLGDYQRVFRIKVPNLPRLEPHERDYLLNHYATYCQTTALYLRGEMDDLARRAAEAEPELATILAGSVEVLRHQIAQWQAELAWVEHLRARMADEQRQSSVASQAPAHHARTLSR